MISSPVLTNSKRSTRRRLIDTTARLFAQHGYNGLTLRSVAKEARANIASVNYHFGSKDCLVLEMLRERIEPINSRRLELLEEAKNRNGNNPPTAYEIFHSLIYPIGEEISRCSKSRWSLAELVARTFTEPVSFIERMHNRFFSKICKLYHKELTAVFPNANAKEIHWHLHLAVSSMLGALAQHRRLHDFTQGACYEEEVEEMIERLIQFVTHGFVLGITDSSNE